MEDCLCLNRQDDNAGSGYISESAVFVHVYDLDNVTSKVNAITRHVAQSGVFHVGVQVYGDEWSFGQHDDYTTGITCNRPKEHFFHVYRESVHLGDTDLSRAEVWLLLERLKPEWPGNSYQLLHRNCITFADSLSQELGVGRIPEFIWRLPRQGAGLANQIKNGMQTLRELDDAVGMSSGMQKVSSGWNRGMSAVGLKKANPQEDRLEDDDDMWRLTARDRREPPAPDRAAGRGGGHAPEKVAWPAARDGGEGRPSTRFTPDVLSRQGNDIDLINRMSRSSDAIPISPLSARAGERREGHRARPVPGAVSESGAPPLAAE